MLGVPAHLDESVEERLAMALRINFRGKFIVAVRSMDCTPILGTVRRAVVAEVIGRRAESPTRYEFRNALRRRHVSVVSRGLRVLCSVLLT